MMPTRVVRLFLPDPPSVVPLIERLSRRSGGPPPPWLATSPVVEETPPAPTSEVASEPVATPVEEPPTIDVAAVRAAAEAEGMRAAASKIDAVIDRYLEGIRRAERVAAEVARPPAEDVVALALVVAREVIGHEAGVDRDFLAAVVEGALRLARGDAEIRLRLGAADLAEMRRRRPEMIASGLEVVADDDLGPGDCVVESRERTVDATIATRLEAVREALIDVLRHPLERAILSVVG